MKRIILRKCVVTNEQLPKKELLRVVKTPENTVIIDSTGKANGRGAYLKKSYDAIALAKKTKALERSLKITVPELIYDQLMDMISE